MNTSELLFFLLRHEVCGIPPSAEESALCELRASLTAEKTDALYTLAKKHDLLHLVADALTKLGLADKAAPERREKIAQAPLLALYRYERMRYAYEKSCEALEQANIPFLPLKGAVLRDYYPEPWMRNSCDIDILVHENDLETAADALCAHASLTRKAEKGAHDLSLYSAEGVHVELHFKAAEENTDAATNAVLSRLWEYCTPQNGSYRYVMTGEMFYFYHIAHMAKHLRHGGCGIRPFLDLWILEHRAPEPLNRTALSELLRAGALERFAAAAKMLSEIWFSDAAHSEDLQLFERFILTGGVYGSVGNQVAVGQSKQGGKAGYTRSKILPPPNYMRLYYPILQRHGWALPFCHLHRWLRLLFTGDAGRAMGRLRVNRNISDEGRNAVSEMLKQIGL